VFCSSHYTCCLYHVEEGKRNESAWKRGRAYLMPPVVCYLLLLPVPSCDCFQTYIPCIISWHSANTLYKHLHGGWCTSPCLRERKEERRRDVPYSEEEGKEGLYKHSCHMYQWRRHRHALQRKSTVKRGGTTLCLCHSVSCGRLSVMPSLWPFRWLFSWCTTIVIYMFLSHFPLPYAELCRLCLPTSLSFLPLKAL